MEKTIILELGRSTKNKHVYVCNSKDAPIESLYIVRSQLSTPTPQRIKITIVEE